MQVSWLVMYRISLLVSVSSYIILPTILVVISMQISNLAGKSSKGEKEGRIPKTQKHEITQSVK